MFQTVDTDFSPGDTSTETPTPTATVPFQTVDTDFSPGDDCEGYNEAGYDRDGFRPLTRISLLVTTTGFGWRCVDLRRFRPLTRISLLVTGNGSGNAVERQLCFRPLTRISLLVTHCPGCRNSEPLDVSDR